MMMFALRGMTACANDLQQVAPLTAALRSGDAKHVQALTLAGFPVNWLDDPWPKKSKR